MKKYIYHITKKYKDKCGHYRTTYNIFEIKNKMMHYHSELKTNSGSRRGEPYDIIDHILKDKEYELRAYADRDEIKDAIFYNLDKIKRYKQ